MENINSNTQGGEFHIKRLDKSKLKDLVFLYRAVYGSVPEKEYFVKKYDTAFTGSQYIGYIAYNLADIPIAYYGVIPCFLEYGGKTMLSAQSADTMTHPQYRYRGMFVQLAKMTFDLCKEKGILVVFGFPNQNSYHGLTSNLGWQVTENMERFVIPVRSFPLESLAKYSEWTKWIYKKYIQLALRKHLLTQNGLLNSSIVDGFAGVYRDNDYLQYKTYSKTYVIKIGNAKAWIRIKNGLAIGDLELENQNFNLVMESLKKIAGRLGVTQLSFQVSPGTRLHSLFAKEFEPIPSFPVGFKNLGARIELDKVKFTFADIDIF